MAHLVERAAYRDLFDYGGTLSSLDRASVSNIDKAIENAREFAGEVLYKLRSHAAKAEMTAGAA